MHDNTMTRAADRAQQLEALTARLAQLLRLTRGARPGEWVDEEGNWGCDTEELLPRLQHYLSTLEEDRDVWKRAHDGLLAQRRATTNPREAAIDDTEEGSR